MSEQNVIRLCRSRMSRFFNLFFHWYVFYADGNPYTTQTVHILFDVTCWEFFHYRWKRDWKELKGLGRTGELTWKLSKITDLR